MKVWTHFDWMQKAIHHWQLWYYGSCDWEGVWLKRMTLVVRPRLLTVFSHVMTFCHRWKEKEKINRNIWGDEEKSIFILWEISLCTFFMKNQLVIVFEKRFSHLSTLLPRIWTNCRMQCSQCLFLFKQFDDIIGWCFSWLFILLVCSFMSSIGDSFASFRLLTERRTSRADCDISPWIQTGRKSCEAVFSLTPLSSHLIPWTLSSF